MIKTADLDPQRQQELSRKRAEGETPDKTEADPMPGVKRGSDEAATGDHGFLRDDGQSRPAAGTIQHLDEGNNPVVSPRDERHPNAPSTLNADKGAEESHAGALKPAPDTELLEDAYSKNDPGVETKK